MIDFTDPISLKDGITALAKELDKANKTASDAKAAITTLAPVAAGGAAPATVTTTTSTTKDADTIKLKALPDHSDYDTWRMKAIADIAAASGQPAQVLGFLKEIKDGTVTDSDLLSTRDAKMASLDMKLYNAILNLATGTSDDQKRIWSRLKSEVPDHCGRRAFRILDHE